MRNLQSLRLLLADKDKEIQRLKERLSLYESDNDTVIMTGEKWEEIKQENKRLKKELTEEKKASIRMYNKYTEVKEKIDKAIEYIKSELYWCTDNVYTMNMVDLEKLVDILKGEDKE